MQQQYNLHVSTFEAQLRQAVDLKRQAEDDLEEARREIATL